MSRIGKLPIPLTSAVKAVVSGHVLNVEGPKGKLKIEFPEFLDVKVEADNIVCSLKDTPIAGARARFGLFRSHIANMVEGVSKGFIKDLEINGVGFRANLKGKELELALGFSHPIVYRIPDGITLTVDKQTKIQVAGADKQQVGQTAAEIRRFRKPEPYKGKGIKYSTETVRRKAGKAAASASS